MQRIVNVLIIATGIGLSACSGSNSSDAGAAVEATAAASSAEARGTPTATPQTPAPGPPTDSALVAGDGSAADPAETGSADTQAGWYRGGTFQPCGRDQSLRLSSTSEIESRIRAGGMQGGEPVYVRLEGASMDAMFHVARVVQVGSPTPVRDCPMTGTVIQGG